VTNPRTSAAKEFQSFWKLGGLSFSQLCRGVFDEIMANNVFGHAAELAFYCLFALFPLILIMMTLFGLFVSQSSELQDHLLSYFAGIVPPESFQLVEKFADELASHASGGKLTFGIVSALWCVSGAIGAMIDALNLAYHVRETRSWFKVRAIALGLSVLITILLLSAMFLALVGGHLVERLGTGLQLHPMVVLAWKALRWPAIILFVAMSCSLIHYFGANLKQCHRGIWRSPGSALGLLVLFGGSFAFRVYLHFSDTYSASYGSLGAAMILLVWLYVAGLAFVIGGEINAEIERAEKASELGEVAAARLGT
jgi:membrane protein